MYVYTPSASINIAIVNGPYMIYLYRLKIVFIHSYVYFFKKKVYTYIYIYTHMKMPMPRFMIPLTLMSPHRPQAPAPARFCSRVTIHQCKNYNTINIDTNTASIWHIKHILCIFCNVSINLQIYYIYGGFRK